MNTQGTGDKIRRLLAHVWPIEVFVLVNLGILVAILRAHGLRVDWRGFWYIVWPLLRSLPVFLVVGLAATILVRFGLDRSLRPVLRRLRTPHYYIVWTRLWLALLVASYCYGWLKVNVPMINTRLWDQELWVLDAFLHGGISPTLFLTRLFDGTPFVAWVDFWYDFWALTVMWFLVFVTAFHGDEDRKTLVTAKILLWVFGSWIYLSMPALGPIYQFPESWNQGATVPYPRALGVQMNLWTNYQTIQEGIATGQLRAFNPTRGIAAMPSLHVGAHVLFALWAWRHYRPLFVVFLLAAIFTYLGSILTGWHYAIDGWVGAGLAWLSLYLARRFSSWGTEEDEDPEDEGEGEEDLADQGPGEAPLPAV